MLKMTSHVVLSSCLLKSSSQDSFSSFHLYDQVIFSSPLLKLSSQVDFVYVAQVFFIFSRHLLMSSSQVTSKDISSSQVLCSSHLLGSYSQAFLSRHAQVIYLSSSRRSSTSTLVMRGVATSQKVLLLKGS